MCAFHFKSRDSDSKILTAAGIFHHCIFKGICGIDLFDPLYITFTGWNLISHFHAYLLSFPMSFGIFRASSTVLNFPVANVVVNKQTDLRLHICHDIVYRKKQQGHRTVPWEITRQDNDPTSFHTIHDNLLLS